MISSKDREIITRVVCRGSPSTGEKERREWGLLSLYKENSDLRVHVFLRDRGVRNTPRAARRTFEILSISEFCHYRRILWTDRLFVYIDLPIYCWVRPAMGTISCVWSMDRTDCSMAVYRSVIVSSNLVVLFISYISTIVSTMEIWLYKSYIFPRVWATISSLVSFRAARSVERTSGLSLSSSPSPCAGRYFLPANWSSP